ncbi:MAG: hypothetical protein ABIE22_03110 [archaeon]
MRLQEKAAAQGDSFLTYAFPTEILSTNINLTTKSFEHICNRVCSDLEALDQDYNFDKIHIIGASLGCVNATMIANSYPVSLMTLLVPGHCLAESLWDGIMTQHLRKEFESQGIRMLDLKWFWQDISPENNIDNLEDTGISVHLSCADSVIPYRCGKQLVRSMRNWGLEPTVIENNHLGHYLTVFKYWIAKDSLK